MSEISVALQNLGAQRPVDEKDQERLDFCDFFGGGKLPSVVAVFQNSFVSEFTINIHMESARIVPLRTPPRGDDPDQGAVFEDVQAAIAIARLCAKMNTSFEAFRDGYQHNHNEKTVVAIGLHNGASYKACRLCSDGFIQLKTDGGFVDGLGTKMANFSVCGKDYTQSARRRDDVQVSEALIVRTRDARSGLPFFLCGGHDGQGTAAAGIFLAENWGALCSLFSGVYDLKKHSLAVVIEFDHADPVNGRKRIVGAPRFASLP